MRLRIVHLLKTHYSNIVNEVEQLRNAPNVLLLSAVKARSWTPYFHTITLTFVQNIKSFDRS